jgi:hypothetical protein
VSAYSFHGSRSTLPHQSVPKDDESLFFREEEEEELVGAYEVMNTDY